MVRKGYGTDPELFNVVGIYVVHPALLYPLERSGTALRLLGVDGSESVLWHLLLTPAEFFGSWLIYVAVREWGASLDGQVRLPGAWSVRSADSE